MIWELMEEWGKAREYLLPALEYCGGTHSEDDIICGLIQGQYKLWLWEKSAHLTEFRQYPRMKALNIFLVGGDMEELFAHEPKICAFALKNGATRITNGGRVGWERALIPLGYQKLGIVMAKDI